METLMAFEMARMMETSMAHLMDTKKGIEMKISLEPLKEHLMVAWMAHH